MSPPTIQVRMPPAIDSYGYNYQQRHHQVRPCPIHAHDRRYRHAYQHLTMHILQYTTTQGHCHGPGLRSAMSLALPTIRCDTIEEARPNAVTSTSRNTDDNGNPNRA